MDKHFVFTCNLQQSSFHVYEPPCVLFFCCFAQVSTVYCDMLLNTQSLTLLLKCLTRQFGLPPARTWTGCSYFWFLITLLSGWEHVWEKKHGSTLTGPYTPEVTLQLCRSRTCPSFSVHFPVSVMHSPLCLLQYRFSIIAHRAAGKRVKSYFSSNISVIKYKPYRGNIIMKSSFAHFTKTWHAYEIHFSQQNTKTQVASLHSYFVLQHLTQFRSLQNYPQVQNKSLFAVSEHMENCP